MNVDSREPANLAGTMAEQWLSTACSMTEWYLGLLDPRPDLARPARSARLFYAWWW